MAEYNENVMNLAAVPAPAKVEEPSDGPVLEFDQDDILALINSVDEDKHCPCHIMASLELLTDVKEGTILRDVPEENRTPVDDMLIENCSVDTFTLDGELVNIVLNFDSPKDAYLLDLKTLLDRFRLMQNEIAENADAVGKVPVFSIAFMPKALDGHGVMNVSFPVAYFRTLDDAGINASMHMLFHLNNLEFMKIELDADTVSEIKADVLREMESGTNGEIFND